MKALSLTVSAILFVSAGAAHAAPVFVDASMLPGVGDGTSWGAAYERIQQGIDAAARVGGGEVWVREGTYYENVGIPDGVAVYGGFAGGEASLDERDPAAHVTVIDGGKLEATVGIFGGAGTRLDGFTVQNGLNGLNRPGGMLGGGIKTGGNVVIANNVIRWNACDPGWGGGIYVGEGGVPLITGNLIYENRASSGGGLYAISSSPRLVGNVAIDNRPAGLAVWASSATIVNNVALRNGVGISLASSRGAYIGNNVCANNGSGIGVDLDFSSVIANNYLFANGSGVYSGNTVVSAPGAVVHNAFFQNGQPVNANVTLGAGNLMASCLPNTTSLSGGFRLTPASPCVDAGLTSAVPADLLTDRDGEPRVTGAAVDIGADELSFPVTLLSATGTAGRYPWFTTPVGLSLSASADLAGTPPAATELSLDGGATWSAYAGPFTLSDEGLARLVYRSSVTDGTPTGTVIELDKEALVGVDTRDPTAAVSASPALPAATWHTEAPVITLVAEDPAPGSGLDVVETWGCQGVTPYRGPVTFACDGNPSSFNYRLRDRAGRTITGALSLLVDVIPPTTFVSPDPWPTAGWQRGDTLLTVTASNPGSGVDRIEHSLDGAGWLPYAGPILVTAEGRNALFTRAWDPLGRVGAVAQTPVWIDRTPPASTVTTATPATNGWFRQEPWFTPSATDALSGVARINYSWDDGVSWYDTWLSPFSVPFQGVTTVLLSAVDVAGNPEPAHPLLVQSDWTPPVTTARADGTVGLDGSYVSPVSVTLDAADAHSGVATTWYVLDGAGAQVYGGPFTVLADGLHQVTFHSVDVAGNGEAVQPPLVFRVDRTPPTCSIAVDGVPGPTGWYGAPVTVSFAATGAPVLVEYSLDGIGWTPYTGPFTLDAEGQTTVACRTADAAGNVGTVQDVVGIDLTCPVTTPVFQGTPGLPPWFTSPVTVSLQATDAGSGVARTEYTLDGILWLDYAGPFDVAAQGLTHVQYHSIDNVHCVEAVKSGDLSIDTLPPARVSSAPPPGATGVSRTSTITVTYGEDVWAGPALGTVTLTCLRGGSTTTAPIRPPSLAGRVLTILPRLPLPPRSTCTVNLPGDVVRDVAGLASAVDGFSFGTR